MFGAYIKGRGWIKKCNYSRGIICCRYPSDIHKDFLFVNKNTLYKRMREYPDHFEKLEFEYKRIPEDTRIDKRVIPSKRHRGRSFIRRDFNIENNNTWMRYCNLCGWSINNEKEKASHSGVCIHCLKFLKDSITEIYNEMDDEIKKSWVRAKVMDEI